MFSSRGYVNGFHVYSISILFFGGWRGDVDRE
jgi:hypothetical protein